MDSAFEIVTKGVENHIRMIKEFKGVPGVKEERLLEGYKVCVCKDCTKSIIVL